MHSWFKKLFEPTSRKFLIEQSVIFKMSLAPKRIMKCTARKIFLEGVFPAESDFREDDHTERRLLFEETEDSPKSAKRTTYDLNWTATEIIEIVCE